MVGRMGIRFAAVPKSHVAATPNYIGAAGLDQRQRQQAEALRSKQIGGGIGLYNATMGKKSPIYDSLFPESGVNTSDTALGDSLDLTSLTDTTQAADPAMANMTPFVDEGSSSLTTMMAPSPEQIINPVAEQSMLGDMAAEEIARQAALEQAAMSGVAETALADTAVSATAENALGTAIGGGGGNPYLTAALMANNLGLFG